MSEKKTGINFGPAFIAFAAFLWTTDVVVRGNLEGKLTAVQIALLDHSVIILLISPYIIKYAPKLLEFTVKEWIAVLWIGIGGSALAVVLLTEGFFLGDYPFQYAAIVVLLQQTQPIIAIGVAHLMLKERLPRFFYLLSLISVSGVALIIYPSFFVGDEFVLFSQFQITNGIVAGLLGLGAAILWGSSTVMGKYILNHGKQRPQYLQMTTYRFFIAAIFLWIFTGIYPRAEGYPSFASMSGEVFLSILYLGIVVGLISLAFYYYGLKTTHASVSSIAELVYPLSYFVIMPILNIQPLEPIQYIGGAILLISTTILSYIYGKIPVDTEELE